MTRFMDLEQSTNLLGLYSCTEILQNCQHYLIFEECLDGSIKLFNSLLEEQQNGIIITRSHPDKLNTTLKLRPSNQIDRYWLSSEDFDYVIHPWDITNLIIKIENFLQLNDRGVILLNGLEYLSTYNNPNIVMNLIFKIAEIIGNTDVKLLITMDPLALGYNFIFDIENKSELCFIPNHSIKEVLN